VIVPEILVQIFVLISLALALLALAPMISSEPGPQLAHIQIGHWRALVLSQMCTFTAPRKKAARRLPARRAPPG
jgi:hypothetical protein